VDNRLLNRQSAFWKLEDPCIAACLLPHQMPRIRTFLVASKGPVSRSFASAIIDQRSCILKAFNPPAHHVPYILLKTKGLILILLCDFKTLHIPSETPYASHLDSYSLFKEPCIAFPANRTSFRQGGESYLLNSPCQELFQTLFFFAALPSPALLRGGGPYSQTSECQELFSNSLFCFRLLPVSLSGTASPPCRCRPLRRGVLL